MKTLTRVGWELVDLGRYCELLETSRFDANTLRLMTTALTYSRYNDAASRVSTAWY